MAAIVVEAFEAGDLLGGDIVQGGSTIQTATPPGAWSVFYANRAAGAAFTQSFKQAASEIYGHIHVRSTTMVSKDFLHIRHADATRSMVLATDASARVTIRNSADTLVATGTQVLVGNAWHCLQWRMRVGDVTGSSGTWGLAQVRLNSITSPLEIDVTDIDTKNGANTTVSRWEQGIAAGSLDYDDIVIYDTTGGVNDSWTGCIGFQGLFGDAAGDITQFTPLSGSNWSNVDEAPHDTDTTYVSTSTTGNLDLYHLPTPSSAYSVSGPIAIKSRLRKVEPGTRLTALVYKTSGATQAGPDTGITTTYGEVRLILDKDATDAVVWTDAKIASLQIGQKAQ